MICPSASQPEPARPPAAVGCCPCRSLPSEPHNGANQQDRQPAGRRKEPDQACCNVALFCVSASPPSFIPDTFFFFFSFLFSALLLLFRPANRSKQARVVGKTVSFLDEPAPQRDLTPTSPSQRPGFISLSLILHSEPRSTAQSRSPSLVVRSSAPCALRLCVCF